MNWKDPAIATRLAQLWHEGHSCSTIARMMGAVSRNAVIGAARRQDLPFRGYRPGDTAAKTSLGGKSRPQAQRGKIARKKNGKPFRFQASPNMVRQVAFVPAPLPMPAADDMARVSFVDLENHHCRFITLKEPAGPYVEQFCGLDRMPGSSYCAGHHARTAVTVAPRDLRNVVPMPKKELQVA